MLRKVAVVLSITLGFGILSSINVASAVVVDPSTKSCLDKTVGAKAANKIVSAKTNEGPDCPSREVQVIIKFYWFNWFNKQHVRGDGVAQLWFDFVQDFATRRS